MPIDEFIIYTYCVVDDYFKKIISHHGPLRQRGEKPKLSDPEVITMEIVGEYLGQGSDKGIWRYFRMHWQNWFPNLGCRTSFTRQSANLRWVKEKIQIALTDDLCKDQDLYLFDGFPIPTCHIKRYKRSRNPLKVDGAVGYCAAKDDKYFGFKGHLLITQKGVAQSMTMAAANVDERDALPEIISFSGGDLIADKGLIRPLLSQELEEKGIQLHTPLRKNMIDSRPKEFVFLIMNIRRKIETVIGQLVDRFKIQSIRAKDLWHLGAKVGRKILAHTLCFLINEQINPHDPLKLELLVDP